MKQIKTLGELNEHVNTLIKKHGEDGSCVVWLVTRDDLVTTKGGVKTPVTKGQAQAICMEMKTGEYDYINREVKRASHNGMVIRGL